MSASDLWGSMANIASDSSQGVVSDFIAHVTNVFRRRVAVAEAAEHSGRSVLVANNDRFDR